MTGSDEPGFRLSPEAADIARIAAVTGELAAAETVEDIAHVVAFDIADAVRASVSTLILREDDTLRIVGQRGVAADKASRWASFTVHDQNPASEAIRARQPVIAATAEEVAARYPAMAPDTPSSRSVVSLPLCEDDSALGVIGLTFERNWDPGQSELDLLMTFADACAQALRRVRATEAARVANENLRFLARASAELSSSLDYPTTITNVANLAVPGIADWCAVDVIEGNLLTTLVVAHPDPQRAEQARRIRTRYPVELDSGKGGAVVVETGRAALTTDLADAALVEFAQDAEHLEFLRSVGMRSTVVAALQSGERVLGTITLVRTAERPAFTEADLQLAEDLGRRAGVAIENATLHAETVRVAEMLREAVLAAQVSATPGWEVDAHYRADGSNNVGGDFYDSVVLGDGRLAVFVGDVAGHGVQAAAAMAHMRAATRVLLSIDPDPHAVVSGLDRAFDRLMLGRLVSLVYVVLEPDGSVSVANAGHCPPLVVHPDGTTTFLPPAQRPPIGVGRSEVRPSQQRLAEGDTLLLYTDGLIERRTESIDEGLARLARRAGELPGAGLADGLSRLVDEVRGADADDDVAVVAVRRAW